jgi:hypothetical protein
MNSRRDFLKAAGAVVAVAAVPVSFAARPSRQKPWWRDVKWLRVRQRPNWFTGGIDVFAHYRDCSVPIRERRAYALGVRISRERLEDMGAKRSRVYIDAIKSRLARVVLNGALAHDASLRKMELEEIALVDLKAGLLRGRR